MTLKECYQALGGDYDSVMKRLKLPERVERFARMFLDDPSYGMLINSIEQCDMEGAFRAAHTLKGVCYNLSFTRLGDSAARLTDALRPGPRLVAYGDMLTQVIQDYDQTIAAIQALDK